MYSGGWAFSNSRKSVKYPPHDPHTSGSTKAPCFKAVLFGILQKPNKRQSQPETNTSGLYRWDQASRQSRQLPAVHFCQCSGLAFDPVSIEQKAGFSPSCYPVHNSRSAARASQPPAHDTQTSAKPYRASQSAHKRPSILLYIETLHHAQKPIKTPCKAIYKPSI